MVETRYRTVAQTQAGARVREVDEGLRSYMLRVYNYMALGVALTALVIGSALLLLSAFWHQARGAIVRPLPESLRDRLPILDRPGVVSQPAA